MAIPLSVSYVVKYITCTESLLRAKYCAKPLQALSYVVSEQIADEQRKRGSERSDLPRFMELLIHGRAGI